MSNLTYEFENRAESLETYEWDNVWWEHANVSGTPRVLYIGDSISCATRRIATATANGEIFFDGFGTSKALDNPYFFDSVRMFATQQGERKAILFNNGLHGWHLDDESEYAEYYEKMLRFLLDEFKGTPLLVVLTTHVANPECEERVLARNRVAKSLAEKYNLPVVDFYTITKNNDNFLSSDGVHLVQEGYQLLARELVSVVKEFI